MDKCEYQVRLQRDAQSDYIRRIVAENETLRREKKMAEEDNDFLKRVIFALMEKTKSSLVLDERFDAIHNPEFRFDENLAGKAILRVVR